MFAAAIGSQSVPMAATEILKTRVSRDVKARVANLAHEDLLTEALWLRRLVARELRALPPQQGPSVPTTDSVARGSPPECRSKRQGGASRLYVRMRREDRLLLDERALSRCMASATYVSVLVRSHLRAITPLPREELAALKLAISELGAVGRNLNQIARAANQGVPISSVGREEFR